MSRLITSSLIGSIKWHDICWNAEYKKKSYKDLYNMLARIKTPLNEVVKRGIKFENYVYNILNSPKKERLDELSCSNDFLRILRICKDGVFQKKSKSFITINNIEYCLYGKLDVWFPDLIIDIKTTKSFNRDKYLDSMQHVIYIYNEKIETFKYVVAIFENETSNFIKEVKEIDIDLSVDLCKEKIIYTINKIEEFMDKNPELNKLWLEKYSLY